MIESDRTFATTTIYCDAKDCNSQHEEDNFGEDWAPSYADTCDEARDQGWIITKIEDEWCHFCSGSCLKSFF